jgi:copper(I)-binding protein
MDETGYSVSMNRRALILAFIGLPTAARAHSYKQGSIAIGHAWALPSQQSDAQVFFPLVNNGKEADALVGARSNVCTLIELRRNNRYDDPPLTAMPLDPGKPVAMRPTARHLRLMGLSAPLTEGQRFTIILDFLNGGETEVEVYVEQAPGD